MAARDVLRNHWPAITIAVTAAAIACASAVVLRSMPPRMIVMATGPAGGAYTEVGKLYRAALGDDVEVIRTPRYRRRKSPAALVDLQSLKLLEFLDKAPVAWVRPRQLRRRRRQGGYPLVFVLFPFATPRADAGCLDDRGTMSRRSFRGDHRAEHHARSDHRN
jgi:hypothetical protein